MNRKGISTAQTLSLKTIQKLKNGGCEFVFRYYCAEQTQSPEKILRAPEAHLYAQEQITVGTVYELGGGAPRKEGDGPHPEDFDLDKAERDARVALVQAAAVGQPRGSAIYFAVDYDFTSKAIIDRIVAYFAKIEEVFLASNSGTLPYMLGIYGSGLVCRKIKEQRSAVLFSWLAESTGWTESKTYKEWAVKQSIATVTVSGLDYEDCQAPGNFGGFIPGANLIIASTPIVLVGDMFKVAVHSSLNLRSSARIPRDDPGANIVGRLPAGQIVHRLSGQAGDKFWEVETDLNGAHFRGFAAGEFLIHAAGETEMPRAIPAAAPPANGIVAVYMPRKAGTVTKRSEPAGALSLNETGQPSRTAATEEGRRSELAAILAWLAVDKSSNRRYQPTSSSTFCNIYAHDYCFLAGVYLPRVWWMPGAIERLARGETVEPLYEKTIDEQRANDLFRWARDFGLRFGWRQTSTLTELQGAANLGGIGIIVARRKIDGASGHIVAVVPETDDHKARRDKTGAVIAPLQSQAGSRNFQYGTGTLDWWKDGRFADSAFWIHP